ncbi:MAG: GDP-mannose 4,6-dehydratase [Candidatus Omnitrophica bacterium]|nr:GDP-mannose 4,6-dehydratase [Candidatus Omnitrophota bacterium]
MARRALITGITGQDGSYLAEWLLEQGYDVHGIVRRVALEDPLHRMWRIYHLKDALQLHVADLENHTSVLRLLQQVKPDEIYHLAAHSFVGHSSEEECSTLHANLTTTHAMLSGFRDVCPGARFYFAGSSEMFGNAPEIPQRETTPFNPRSTYGVSKCAGFFLTRSYRQTHGLFAVGGILFNHESPRRGFEFVTRKISWHVALIAAGRLRTLKLGNLEARRDWGHAQRYVEAIWKMLQRDHPDEFVIATGDTHTVRQFCEVAFRLVGLDYRDYVTTDPALYRPIEEALLVGDASKAKTELGWTHDVPFEQLVKEMVEGDLERVKLTPHATAWLPLHSDVTQEELR